MNDRRGKKRYPIVLPVSCHGRRSGEFFAITVDISIDGIRLRSKRLPDLDEQIDCNIRGVGSVKARVTWVGGCDFSIRLTSVNPPPATVAQLLLALANERTKTSEAIRLHRRVVPDPDCTDVEVALPDGAATKAVIVNLSASGVALRIDAPLAIGDEIMVGHREAVVARHIDSGIGAVFLDPLDPAAVHERTTL